MREVTSLMALNLINVVEMEMRKLHMGTVSYGYDSMDEIAHQLAVAFGTGPEQGMCYHSP